MGIEEMMNIAVPPRANYLRVVWSELHRMVLEEPIRLRTGELAATVGQVVDHGLLERLVGLDLDRNARVRARVPATEESSPTLADPELLALLRKVKNCPPGA